MAHYIYAYHGGKMPESPEEGAKVMARWQEWLTNLGDSVINPGAPVGMSKTLSAEGVEDNGGANPLGGFSIVQADTMEAAIELAKDCPHMGNGTIEIAEIIEM